VSQHITRSQDPFEGEQSFDTNRTTGTDPTSGDADLSSEPKSINREMVCGMGNHLPISVSKSCGGIVKDAGAINLLKESFSCWNVLCDD
jgi:hypothetical protein